MRIYERYLLAHLFWPTVLVTVGLTGIIWLTQVLRFVDFMLNRGLSIGDFLYLTGLMLPSLLLLILPIALAIAVMYTYNRLTLDSELIVLNAIGVSKRKLANPALMMGGGCTLICYALSLYLMPLANQHFQDIRTFFRDKYSSVLLEEEVFNSPVEGVTLFIRARDNDNTLHGVMLHDQRDLGRIVTMIADRGRMEQTSMGPRFYLEHGVRQERKNGQMNWLSFDTYAVDIAFFAKDVARKRRPEEKNIVHLFSETAQTAQETSALRAEGHYRLTWPLFTLALPMIALAALFSGEFNRRGQWRRMVGGSVAMLGAVMLFFACRNMLAKQSWMWPSLYVLAFGSVLMSLQMMRRFGPIFPFFQPVRGALLPKGVQA